jgi:hypothetical protein
MAISVDTLSYYADPSDLETLGDYVVRVPGGIDGKNQLFTVLDEGLRLPWYFGRNWDALADCLGDLSWLNQRVVVLRHDDALPGLSEHDRRTYLSILIDAVRAWHPGEAHELIVAFPLADRAAIRRLSQD